MSRSVEFPRDFRFGVSMAGFQFEMGDRYHRYVDANTDWWVWVRDPENIARRIVSGDLPENGCNYLEMYRSDHELARSLGLDIYRLNIEWSRIFPHPTWLIEVDVDRDANGFVKDVRIDGEVLKKLDMIADRDAVSLYRDIINDLRTRGFKVILNLHHFTTPLWLHNPIKARASNLTEGPLGLLDERFPIEFAKFAAYAAWRFGDLVDMWSTFNEPMVVITAGYTGPYTGFPPGVEALDKIPRLIANVALAHSLAYNMIKRFDTTRVDPDSRDPAEVGIVYNIAPVYPLAPGDEPAAENLSYFYNDVLLNAIANGTLDMGLNRKDLVRPAVLGGKLDWIGVNYYSRNIVRRVEPRVYEIRNFETVPGYGYACTPNGVSRAGRWCSDFGWEFYPEGIARAVDIARRYSGRIYITENGVADSRDIYRPQSLVNHLYVVAELIGRGIAIKGYMHWALLDNYEWAQGFRMRFGLIEVDYTTKQRRLRGSALLYSEIARSKRISEETLNRYSIQLERF